MDERVKTAVIAIAGVSVIASVAYLVYSGVSSKPVAVSSTKKSRKHAAGASGLKNVSSPKGPSPQKPVTETESDAAASAKGKDEPAEAPVEDLFAVNIDDLSPEARAELSQKAKAAGNVLFGKKSYKEASRYYSQAIKLKPDAIFYGNRAACSANLGNHAEVIDDCTEALKLDPKYKKALERRAKAYESKSLLDKALLDYTAVCMLEEFNNQATVATTDRLLKDIGKEKAQELLKSKEPRLPSQTFITAYMDSFRKTTEVAHKVAEMEPDHEGDQLVAKAYKAIMDRKWADAMNCVNSAVGVPISKQSENLLYNLRGTFAFLTGDIQQSFECFENAIKLDPTDTDSLIKRASIYMEMGDVEGAMQEYSRCKALNASNSDLYYHRGQVRFLTNDLDAAIADYTRSIALDNEFIYAYIQLGVAQFKAGETSAAGVTFEKARRKFPESPEIFNYYGEILLNQELFDEAVLYWQLKKDYKTAEECCLKASEVDPLCDIAYIHLAQLYLQQNRLKESLGAYEKAAAAAQLFVSELFPDLYAKLRTNSGL
ncbi:TOM (translocase of outer membrane) complex component [Irineochytrium annulatum]|nr:TOM (translocase of outer membrane) complex component [Irineochytrium annulatum]